MIECMIDSSSFRHEMNKMMGFDHRSNSFLYVACHTLYEREKTKQSYDEKNLTDTYNFYENKMPLTCPTKFDLCSNYF